MKKIFFLFLVTTMNLFASSFINYTNVYKNIAAQTSLPENVAEHVSGIVKYWEMDKYRRKSVNLLKQYGFADINLKNTLVLEFGGEATYYKALYICLSAPNKIFFIEEAKNSLVLKIIDISKNSIEYIDQLERYMSNDYMGAIMPVIGKGCPISLITYIDKENVETSALIYGTSSQLDTLTKKICSIMKVLIQSCGSEIGSSS